MYLAESQIVDAAPENSWRSSMAWLLEMRDMWYETGLYADSWIKQDISRALDCVPGSDFLFGGLPGWFLCFLLSHVPPWL